MALPPPGTLQPKEPSPRSRQRMQESTPTGTAEPPPSAEPGGRGAGVGRQLRVLLTPLAVAGRRLLPQKRLLGAYGGAAAGRAPAGKRLCLERSPRKAAPGSLPAGTGSGWDSAWDEESDGSDAGDTPVSGDFELSAYERKRLKNITENAKFFAALQLHESAARLQQMANKKQSHTTKRAKPKKAEDETVLRRSMRLQRVSPSGIPLSELPAQPEAEQYPQVPAGPLPMIPEDQVGNSKLADDLLATWMRISEVKAHGTEKLTSDMKRYQDSLNSMVLSEDNIKKVVKYRVCSIAIHPSESIILVAAGDRCGQIGLWNVSCRAEEGARAFTAHNDPISCMQFSPFNPAHLLSVSNESLRCGDVTRAVFDEICRSEDEVNLSSFDFLDDNASTAIVGHWAGDVCVVDRRTPGTSPELSANIGFKRTRTVHVHPVNKQYFVAAGSTDVCVYDVRCLAAERNKPVSSLRGHTKSVASAYFSPVTGSRVVTVCADNKLRVYDTTSLSPTVTALSTVSHNNHTGRWLTRFRAVWDPKQEHCFVVGSMARPRQIEVFQDTGKLLHSFSNLDCLGSICSINVCHPSRNILVGGNSSGRLHVFKE
ncbi:WD repeat-containing protein 76 [Pezoporus wallicus]|uniref:WD repeat-containing protein 76 n=1 Tax=Pezoporus wallicus TaxID=35540 RepID=UPI00254BE1C7|nr:WD repeat-containing protein 76 [Pezoporus wallicus]XP_061302475.1 WD repeat-containing protein 76 [Pezoporus flaviventris]